MDALKRQQLLDNIELEFRELESPKKGTYCVWTCPQCGRILISGGFYGFHPRMTKDIGFCYGTHAVHFSPKYSYRYKPSKLYRNNEQEKHSKHIMSMKLAYLTRQEYICLFH